MRDLSFLELLQNGVRIVMAMSSSIYAAWTRFLHDINFVGDYQIELCLPHNIRTIYFFRLLIIVDHKPAFYHYLPIKFTITTMVLRIAIVGGGVGGLTAAIALRRHPGVSVQVYEQATEFRELGALVGLVPNGLRTLEKLGVTEVLGDDIGWRSPNGVPMCFKHYRTNEVLSRDLNHNVPNRRHHFARMHRAKLQNALLNHLPSDILHLNKKLTSVEAGDGSATAVFEDGTTAQADLIIGADGIKSVGCIKSALLQRNVLIPIESPGSIQARARAVVVG